jgi:hypothetical protein
MTDEDSLFVLLAAGRMELCWPFVIMHCFPQPAKKNHISYVGSKRCFAFHIVLYYNKAVNYSPTSAKLRLLLENAWCMVGGMLHVHHCSGE